VTRAVVLLAGIALAGCRSRPLEAPPIDVARLGAQGRVLDRPPAQPSTWCVEGPIGSGTYRWGGSGSALSIRAARTAGGTMPRLAVDVKGVDGRTTPFLVDTGSSCTTLSTASPLASHARVWPWARVFCRGREGRLAVVPRLEVGSLVGRDATVQLLASTHSWEEPANVLGEDLLRGLLLRHVGGRWDLVPRTAAPAGVAREVPLLAPGLPMVRVVDERGRPGFGMIDTGAPEAIATTRASLGRWRVVGLGDAMVLDARESFDAPDPRVGRWRVDVLIGLGPLSRADWVLDMEGAAWRFLATAPRAR
jgi:hypothetical protein